MSREKAFLLSSMAAQEAKCYPFGGSRAVGRNVVNTSSTHSVPKAHVGCSVNCAECQGVLSPRSNHPRHPSILSPSDSSPKHYTPLASSSQREINPIMANFSIDLLPFIPPGIEIEDGGLHRVSRVMVHLFGNVVHAHEEYVLAVDTQQILDADDIQGFMHQVIDYVLETFHIPVRSSCHHPFGIGLFQLDTTFHKDLLFAAKPHNIDGIEVNFVSHDHALNRRN
jgi:hypothetical protein